MKKFLLYILIFPIFFTNAQTDSLNQSCKADFKYEVKDLLMSPIPSKLVQFYDASEGNVSAWFWDFGDGETSQDQHPTHVFTYPDGAHTGLINPYRLVSLTVLTSDSCTSYFSDSVKIINDQPIPEPDCRAYFQYYQTNYDTVNNTAIIQFKGISDNDSLQYSWDFGNGETSAAQNPEIIFDTSAEEYRVCIEVTGKGDCTSSFCDMVIIKNPYHSGNDSTECFVKFGYKINYDIQTFAPALVLDFYSKNENIVEWYWDFGDGTKSNEPNPTHIFNLPLENDSSEITNPFREVCLTVVTKTGCKTKWCDIIYLFTVDSIYPEPAPSCSAGFKYYRDEDVVSIPELIQYRFIDVSEGDVISRLWQFEDGTTSTDKEFLKGFDFLQETQKVCLTILTEDSCESTWCEIIYNSGFHDDTTYIPESEYTIRYEAYFPEWMSSCAGTVKAFVYYKDSIVNATNYYWSNGAEGQEATGFCPTQTYTVKVTIPNGGVISGNFIFNSDGTVTEIPVNWWISGTRDAMVIRTNKMDDNYTVQWLLCDGTIVFSDSIPLDLINCGSQESNLILTDSHGNVVYSENISLKANTTNLNSAEVSHIIKLFPNPVIDNLNLLYLGHPLDEMRLEICEITGKRILNHNFYHIQSGETISVNVNSLQNGLYICKIFSGNQVLSLQKIIK